MATKGRNRNESWVPLQVPAELDRRTLPMTDRRNRPLQDCPPATVSHSVKERRQEAMSSTGERVTRLPKETYRPSSTSLTFPSSSSLSYEHSTRPLSIHPFQPPNHSLTSEPARFGGGSRGLVRQHTDRIFEQSIPGIPPGGYNFETTGSVSEDCVENGGCSPCRTSSSLANRLKQRRYQSSAEAARVLKSLTYTTLGFLSDVLESVELRVETPVPPEGGDSVILTTSSKKT